MVTFFKNNKNGQVVEAIQWTDNTSLVKNFCKDKCNYSVMDTAWEVGKGAPIETMMIHTLKGPVKANRNDFIAKGLRHGEFHVHSAEEFNSLYREMNLSA